MPGLHLLPLPRTPLSARPGFCLQVLLMCLLVSSEDAEPGLPPRSPTAHETWSVLLSPPAAALVTWPSLTCPHSSTGMSGSLG